MRKFSARWWVTDKLVKWRYEVLRGLYPNGFAKYPYEPYDDSALRWVSDDGESFGCVIRNTLIYDGWVTDAPASRAAEGVG